MLNRLIGAQLLVVMLMSLILVLSIGSRDVALLIAFGFLVSYAYFCQKSGGQHFIKNTPVILAGILLIILGSYRIMFDFMEVQAYIADADVGRSGPVFFGSLLVQFLLLGACVATVSIEKVREVGVKNPLEQITFSFLQWVAWAPLIINALVYFAVFRHREYVEVHTLSRGPIGILLKTNYLTYAAMILLALKDGQGGRSYRATISILVGCIFVYAVLYKLRSPLLFAFLLFIYFHGARFRVTTLIFTGIGAASLFSLVGLVRDPNLATQAGAMMGVLTSVLSLGEFADTLRFAIEHVGVNGSLFGQGIIGSFLGTQEPIANTYAKMIAPEYFEEGGGFGFFFLADLVINFGTTGASLVIFSTGYLLAYKYAAVGGTHKDVFLPIIFANLFAFARNDFGSTFRGVLYVVLALMFVKISWRICSWLTAVWSRRSELLIE